MPDDPKDGKTKTYLECNLGEVTLHHHVLHKESLPAGHLYTTAAGRQELCNTKNVPDLLDTLVPSKGRRISQTLPRSVDIFPHSITKNRLIKKNEYYDKQSMFQRLIVSAD